jgi:fucose permease
METGSIENTGSYKKILTTPAVHLLAFFILFYVGAEVTIGGMV